MTTIAAPITYTVDTGEKLVNETFGHGNIDRLNTGTYANHTVAIEDARRHGDLSLDTSGYLLAAHHTAMRDGNDGCAWCFHLLEPAGWAGDYLHRGIGRSGDEA